MPSAPFIQGRQANLGEFAVHKVCAKLIRFGYHPTISTGVCDLRVDTKTKVLRVEVKSGSYIAKSGQTNITIVSGRGALRRKYSADDADFIIVYAQLDHANSYYILPPDVFTKTSGITVGPGCKYAQYKDAWHLLGEPVELPLFKGDELCRYSNSPAQVLTAPAL